ncbi:MAG: DUF349 domain-containing protein [Lysobacterales bacterium]
MSLKTLLFKPRWQNKNPAIRARAVAESDDSNLLHQLSSIARSDPEADVRLAATRRIEHLDTLFAIATVDASDSVSSYAWRQVMQRLENVKSDDDAKSALPVVDQITDSERVTRLAKKAQSALIRGAAQNHVQGEGLLGDIAIGDPDSQLRLQAAGRVTSESTLKRIASKVRKTDKNLFRALNERLEALQVASGDTTVVADRAVALCQDMESLARADLPKAERSAQLNRLTQTFTSLQRESTLTSDLTLRFDNAARIAAATLADPVEDPLAALKAELAGFTAQAGSAIAGNNLDEVKSLLRGFAELDEKLMAADAGLHAQLSEQLDLLTSKRESLLAGQRPSPALIKLCEQAEKPGRGADRADFLSSLRTRWQTTYSELGSPTEANKALKQRFDAAVTALTERQAKAQEKRLQAAEAFVKHLDELEPLLDNGDLHKAAAMAQKAGQALNRAGKKHPDSGRLTQLRGKLQEMRQWQHWANDEVRQRLVEQAQAIPGSGMHPDAMAGRVKELRARWKDLDRGERLPGDPPNKPLSPRLYREFQSALETAFEPARPFFEKRAEVRTKHLDDLNALCDELSALKPDGNNWDEVSRGVGQARGSLRRLTEVPHKERAALASRLKGEADRLDEALKGQYEVVERRKRKIIEEVTALIDEPDLTKAVEAAKSAQGRWKEAGRLRRGLDQKLWKEYRAAADQVFGRLDEQRKEARDQAQASRQQLLTLIDQAKSLDSASDEFPRQLELLHQQWRDSGASDRKLQEQFAVIVDQKESDAQQAKRQLRAQARLALRDVARRCHRLEAASTVSDADRQQLTASLAGVEAPQTLRSRCEHLVNADPAPNASSPDDNLSELMTLCIEAEFLSGVESPESEREARMAYQVQRLSQRMGGESSQSFSDEATALEDRWLGCGPLPLGQDSLDALARFEVALLALDNARP